MAIIKVMYQNSLDEIRKTNPLNEKNTAEFISKANNKLQKLRDIIQFYAQNTKEMYQTFESKQDYDNHARLILEAAEEPEASEEDIKKATEEMMKISGISAERLEKLKASQSPIRPLIAGVVTGIAAAIGLKIGMDQYTAWIDTIEKGIAGDGKKAVEKLYKIVEEYSEIDVDNGYTQLVSRQAAKTGVLDPDKLLSGGIGDFVKQAEDLGFGEEFWTQSGAKGKESFEILKKLASEKPNMDVTKFFNQKSIVMSGKTLKSPFGLKAGIGKLVRKTTVPIIKKAATSSASTLAFTGTTIFGLPAALTAGIFAGGAALGLLTVAALRKWKGNRLKLLMGCIEALDDIVGV